jgi:hypothetical protein
MSPNNISPTVEFRLIPLRITSSRQSKGPSPAREGP